MDKSRYIAALLHLQAAGRSFCAAFRDAAAAAQAVDPQGDQHDPAASEIMVDLAAHLRAVCAFVPGAREVLQVALAPAPDRKE